MILKTTVSDDIGEKIEAELRDDRYQVAVYLMYTEVIRSQYPSLDRKRAYDLARDSLAIHFPESFPQMELPFEQGSKDVPTELKSGPNEDLNNLCWAHVGSKPNAHYRFATSGKNALSPMRG